MNLDLFFKYADLFSKNNFNLYLVGGSSRDYLLNLDFKDFDFATDATPFEMKKFLPDFNYTFEKFGNAHKGNIDITTFRIEENYFDYRHPSKIIFSKDMKDDYKRRDFTINAIYIDKNLKIYDFTSGLDDLKKKLIKFIGDPEIRIKEDPLRILRAFRFSKKLGFEIESKSLEAIKNNIKLVNKLNKDKIKSESSK